MQHSLFTCKYALKDNDGLLRVVADTDKWCINLSLINIAAVTSANDGALPREHHENSVSE